MGLAIASLNAQPVAFDYFIDASYVSLSLLLVLALMLGSVLGMLVAVWLLLRLQHENRSLKRRMQQTTHGYDPIQAFSDADADEAVVS